MQQKEQGKGAREGKGTLKKIKYIRKGMYGIKKRCSLEAEWNVHMKRENWCASERKSMQHSTREKGKRCPGGGECKQERKKESTANRAKVQESDKATARKRGKAHAKEEKHMQKRGNTQ